MKRRGGPHLARTPPIWHTCSNCWKLICFAYENIYCKTHEFPICHSFSLEKTAKQRFWRSVTLWDIAWVHEKYVRILEHLLTFTEVKECEKIGLVTMHSILPLVLRILKYNIIAVGAKLMGSTKPYGFWKLHCFTNSKHSSLLLFCVLPFNMNFFFVFCQSSSDEKL